MHFICQQKNLVLCHRGEYTLYTLANNQPTMSRTQRIHDALSVQLKPETLFIDDTIKNIETAHALGLKTIHLQWPQTLPELGL